MNRPWIYANQVIDQFHGNWTLQGWIADVRAKHEYLVELEAIARSRGMEPQAVFQGAHVGPFEILAPSPQRYISLIPHLDKTPPPYRSELKPRSFAAQALGLLERVKETMDIETLDHNPPATSDSNETSVVQLGMYENRKILLTADVGPEGLKLRSTPITAASWALPISSKSPIRAVAATSPPPSSMHGSARPTAARSGAAPPW
jgi:hypothetical protein